MRFFLQTSFMDSPFFADSSRFLHQTKTLTRHSCLPNKHSSTIIVSQNYLSYSLIFVADYKNSHNLSYFNTFLGYTQIEIMDLMFKFLLVQLLKFIFVKLVKVFLQVIEGTLIVVVRLFSILDQNCKSSEKHFILRSTSFNPHYIDSCS